MRPRQESLLPGFSPHTAAIAHGGEHTLGKRKARRPFDPKQALHVVLRSSKARGSWSMLQDRNAAHIHAFTYRLANRWGVRIYRFANVGNHIHLLIRARSRAVFQRFIRELSGTIAIIVTGAKKASPLKKNSQNRGFWDHLVFTRIVHFGRDYEQVARYLIKNLFEGAGVPIKKLLAQGRHVMTIRGDPPSAV